MQARNSNTIRQVSSDGNKQSTSLPKGARQKRAGLVALRRNKLSAELASVGEEKQRHNMIELAAYYRAEQRGFVPGSELQDWLDAEQEIGARLDSRELKQFK